MKRNDNPPKLRISQLLNLPTWFIYLFSAAITLFTLWVRLQLGVPSITRTLMILFMLPIILSAYLGGLRAGILSTALTAFCVWYFLIPPVHTFQIGQSYDFIQWVVLVSSGVLVSVLTESLHRSRKRLQTIINEHNQTQQALNASEANYRDLVENSRTLICTHDLAGNLLSVNEAAVKLTGYSRETLLKTNLKETLSSNGEEQFAVYIKEITTHGQAKGTMKIRTKSGEIRIWAYENTLRAASTTEPIVFGFAQDITERTRAEEEVAKLARFPAENPNPVMRANRDGRLTYANKASAPLLALWNCKVNEYLPKEYITYISSPDFEISKIMPDVSCDNRIFSLVLTPIQSENYVNIYASDITERKLAEQIVHQSEERFRHTLDNMLEGCQIIDFNWRYLYLNPVAEKHSRRPSKELLGQIYMDMWPDAETTEGFQTLKRSMQERIPQQMQSEFTYPDGVVCWFDLAIYPIPEGIFVLSVDITERKLNKEEALINRVKLEAALASTSDAIFISDANGHFIEFNDAFATFHKFADKNECAKTLAEYPEFLEVFHPNGELAPLEEWAVPRALRGEVCANEEYFLRRKDTGESWVGSYSFSPIRDKAGVIIGSVVVGRDITEKKQAEDALRKSQTQLQAIIDYSPSLISIKDLDGNIILANRGFAVLDAPPLNELIGKNVFDIFPQEVAQQLWNNDLAVLHANAPVQFEEVVKHKDGIWHTYWTVKFPIYLQSDRPMGICAIANDITESKQAEKALQESEERYRKLLELAPIGIAVHSEGKIVFTNPAGARLLGGRSEEQIIGRPISSIIHPDGLQKSADRIRRMMNGEQGLYPAEDTYLRLDGAPIQVEVMATTLSYQGKPAVQVIVTDITERKLAQEQLLKTLEELKRSNSELEQFAYVASHDLQEPLRAVAGTVQLLQKRYHGQLDERADEYINLAMDGSSRMQTLITDLLEYSRVDRYGNPIQTTDAGAALKSALHNLDEAIQQSGAAITNGTMPKVKADATQLTQLFQNLIGNAIKFHSERPLQIHIEAEELMNEWHFSVSDNGIGIEPQYFERIFLVFQRLHTRREYPGTGIGLSICKKIIERHGGRIWVESKSGHGTTFHFTIPHRR